MSHTTQVVIVASSGIGLELNTGNRKLAEFHNINVRDSLEFLGEDAAALLMSRMFLTNFPPSTRGLISHLLSIEEQWEEERHSCYVSGLDDRITPFEYLWVTIHHRD